MQQKTLWKHGVGWEMIQTKLVLQVGSVIHFHLSPVFLTGCHFLEGSEECWEHTKVWKSSGITDWDFSLRKRHSKAQQSLNGEVGNSCLSPQKWPPRECKEGQLKSDKEVIVSPHIIRWPWEVTKAKNSARLRKGFGHFYRQQVKPVTIANVKKTTMGKKTKSLALGPTDLWSYC